MEIHLQWSDGFVHHPTCLPKRLEQLESIFDILAVYYHLHNIGKRCRTQITFVEAPSLYLAHKQEADFKIEWISKPFNLNWCQGWATMMLSYYSQVMFFYVRGQMMQKTEERVAKLINTLTTVVILFLCSFSVAGYLAMGENSVPILYPLRKKQGTIILI